MIQESIWVTDTTRINMNEGQSYGCPFVVKTLL